MDWGYHDKAVAGSFGQGCSGHVCRYILRSCVYTTVYNESGYSPPAWCVPTEGRCGLVVHRVVRLGRAGCANNLLRQDVVRE